MSLPAKLAGKGYIAKQLFSKTTARSAFDGLQATH